jgi:hypothetical protein
MNQNPGIEVPEELFVECEDAIVGKFPILYTGIACGHKTT